MIPGFSGHLVAEALLESRLPSSLEGSQQLSAQVRAWRHATRHLGPASSLAAVAEAARSLLAVLGFEPGDMRDAGGSHRLALLHGARASNVVLVVPWREPLARYWREAVLGAARHHAEWCILFNGTAVRVVCPRRLTSRRHVEVDLALAADDPRTAAALTYVAHADALVTRSTASRAQGLAQLIADSEAHRAVVSKALRAGVLAATGHLLGALAAGRRAGRLDAAFDQSLTIVYRVLFLLFAEDRSLVPMWHPVYRESYSIDALRACALRGQHGVWDALRAIGRLAHAGCRAGSLRVTPFNGRLFSPRRLPLAERRNLDDEAARRAILALSTRRAPDGESMERVSYRELGVEELGAVYETLLDYRPTLGGTSSGVTLVADAGVRKATGTFYTPQPLVRHLVREALAPLVQEASPERILALRVLDPSMGSGAFLVGACRYLAGAYEHALVEHGRCIASDIGPAERAAIRRTVAERCLYGVDLNPTAVHLAQLSLWLATLAADRPLSFLDHHLRVGNSLLGTWLARLREAPARARRRDLPLFPEQDLADAVGAALPIRWRLSTGPSETAADVREKERALAALESPDSHLRAWGRVADLWCASWLASPPVPASLHRTLADALLDRGCALPANTADELLARVRETRERLRLFHWELEFPEVFFDERGARRADAGFDAVIGNPPWDMIRADSQGDRTAQRLQSAAVVRFVRESGVYEAQADGQVNCYQLFVDRAIALTRPSGRIGLLLPSGIATDRGSAAVRRLLFSRCAVERLLGFDNRTGTFPIHRSMRFVLLSATAGARTREVACRFGETDAAALDRFATPDGRPDPHWFTARVSMPLLEKVSGADDLAIPEFRSPVDVAIAERAADLFAPLGADSGWGAQFGRELNATDDRRWLLDGGTGWPVLEGKSIEPFRACPARARWHIRPADARRLLGSRPLRPRLAYRDVASAGNRQTLIAALLPAHTASTHTLFCLRTPLARREQHYLAALLNSFVLNHLVRLRVSTHVTTAIVERLPVPTAAEAGPLFGFLARAAARLARAEDAAMRAEMNAQVAHLYRLSGDEFAHVLASFRLVPEAERRATLDRHRATRLVLA